MTLSKSKSVLILLLTLAASGCAGKAPVIVTTTTKPCVLLSSTPGPDGVTFVFQCPGVPDITITESNDWVPAVRSSHPPRNPQ